MYQIKQGEKKKEKEEEIPWPFEQSDFQDIPCSISDHNQNRVVAICTYEFCSENSRQMCGTCQDRIHIGHQSDPKNRFQLNENIFQKLNDFQREQIGVKQKLKKAISDIIDQNFDNYYKQIDLNKKNYIYEQLSTVYNKNFVQMLTKVKNEIDSQFSEQYKYNKYCIKFNNTNENNPNIRINELQVKSSNENKNKTLIKMIQNMENIETKFELQLSDNLNIDEINKNGFIGFIDNQILIMNKMKFEELAGPYEIINFYGGKYILDIVIQTQHGKSWADVKREQIIPFPKDLKFIYNYDKLKIQLEGNTEKTITRPQNSSLCLGVTGKMTVTIVPNY